MDDRTGEIFNFDSMEELDKAIKANSYLKELRRDCEVHTCEYLKTEESGRRYCGANRKTRRQKKCFA